MKDVATTAALLRELKGMGIQLVVDDFGAGYFSLTHFAAVSPVFNRAGKLARFVGIQMDVTARVDAEIALVESKKLISEANAQLLQLSVTDFLTGLKNRRAFDEGLEIAMSHTLRSAKPFTVVLMDVDQFKSINDEYGHAAGDEVLREFASLMERSLRLEDLAARYGGDEFVILLEENSSDALAWSHRTAYFLGWRPNTSRKPPGTIAGLGGSGIARTALRVKTAQLRRLYRQQSMGDGAGRRICIGLHEAND